MAEVYLIEVHLEDPGFRVPPFELEGKNRLLELPLEALVRSEEEDLGQLLGDRAPALDDPATPVVLIHGPRDADGIDTPV